MKINHVDDVAHNIWLKFKEKIDKMRKTGKTGFPVFPVLLPVFPVFFVFLSKVLDTVQFLFQISGLNVLLFDALMIVLYHGHLGSYITMLSSDFSFFGLYIYV